MGPKVGDVYELDPSPETDVGPWSARKGPGVVLAVVGDVVQFCPLTSAEQKGLVRISSALFTEPVAGLTPPVWAAIPYTFPVHTDRFERLKPRGQLDKVALRLVRVRLAGMYGLPPPSEPKPG